MDDKEYEAATAALYQAMGESSGITVECFGSSCRVQGKSGSWYQIDVLTSQSNGLQTVRTAIECKYWQKRVTRNVVSNLITTVEDTNIEKGVIVSKEGFTSGAIALAKQKNISLVEMREPNDADWEGKIKTIHIMMHITSLEFYDVECVKPPQQAGTSIQFTASGQDITIKEPGKETKTLDQIVNAALSSEHSADQSLEVRFLAGTTMRIVGFDKSAMIEAVRFKVRHHVHEREIVIDAAEVIRLIVKEVFEERQFHIRHDGQIVETTDPPTVDTQ